MTVINTQNKQDLIKKEGKKKTKEEKNKIHQNMSEEEEKKLQKRVSEGSEVA